MSGKFVRSFHGSSMETWVGGGYVKLAESRKINSPRSTMQKKAISNCRAAKLQELANVMRLNLFIVVCFSEIELKSI